MPTQAAGSKKHTITVEDMRKICEPCADKMESTSMKSFEIDLSSPAFGEGMPDGVPEKLRAFALQADGEIKGVEIFASGEWNGDKYVDKDLDQIIKAFHETKDLLKPYLKLGHSDGQKLLAEDELPAAGWVTNVYKKGGKLLADFAGMPRKIYELVKAGAYKRVSSEIFINVNVNGQKYGKALKAVALLGGETPAVQTLDDIHALYTVSESVRAYANDAEVKVYEFDSAQEEFNMAGQLPPAQMPAAPQPAPTPAPAQPLAQDGDCMQKLAKIKLDLDTMTKRMSDSETEIKKLSDENASLKSSLESKDKEFAESKARAESLEKDLAQSKSDGEKSASELREFKKEARGKEIKSKIAAMVDGKKILPSQSPALEAMLLHASDSPTLKFKVGDKDVDGLDALILQFVENGAGLSLPTEPRTELGAGNPVDPANGQSVHEAVLKYMTEHKELSYKQCYVKVIEALEEPKK